MSLRIAPYNDAMRLGQGFNSYTHELCLDGAVAVKQRIVTRSQKNASNPSQVVSYSARYVEKLSDVVEAMNLSYSSAIKRGTIEISGNSSTVDEDTFKSSDINIVVTVKVVNQTIAIEDESKFQALDKPGATAARFNEIYGDSYISGFIEGGDFTGIVSIKVIDRSNVNHVVSAVKQSLLSATKPELEVDELVLGPTSSGDTTSSLSSALKDTQSTISISWMGGGQIKEPGQAWDIDSMYAAAAAFPASVADCPQRTWAILTPYKANRSFVNWCMGSPLKTLQYDLISSFTAELFDRFMDYKVLLKRVQHILSNRKLYRMRIAVVNAIDVSVGSLLCLRAALRNEQTKIVEAIEVLGRNPGVLKTQAAWTNGHSSEIIRRIVAAGLGTAKDWQPPAAAEAAAPKTDAGEAPSVPIIEDPPAVTVLPSAAVDAELVTAESHNSLAMQAPVAIKMMTEVSAADASTSEQTPETTPEGTPQGTPEAPAAYVVASNDSQPPADGDSAGPAEDTTVDVPAAPTDFNFDTLIAPEVWEELLPELINREPVTLSVTAPLSGVHSLNSAGVGGLTSFTVTAPPPDGASPGGGGPAVISQSYADMQRDLKIAEEAKAAAQARQVELEATIEKMTAEQWALKDAEERAKQLAAAAEAKAAAADAKAAAADDARNLLNEDLRAERKTLRDTNEEYLDFKRVSESQLRSVQEQVSEQMQRADQYRSAMEEMKIQLMKREEEFGQRYRDQQREMDMYRQRLDEVHRQIADSPFGGMFRL